MKKSDFIEAVAAQAKVAPALVESVLNGMAIIVPQELKRSGRVRVPGLCNMQAKQYGARPGRNLATGEDCVVPAATRLRLSPVTSLEAVFKGAGVEGSGIA